MGVRSLVGAEGSPSCDGFTLDAGGGRPHHTGCLTADTVQHWSRGPGHTDRRVLDTVDSVEHLGVELLGDLEHGVVVDLPVGPPALALPVRETLVGPGVDGPPRTDRRERSDDTAAVAAGDTLEPDLLAESTGLVGRTALADSTLRERRNRVRHRVGGHIGDDRTRVGSVVTGHRKIQHCLDLVPCGSGVRVTVDRERGVAAGFVFDRRM